MYRMTDSPEGLLSGAAVARWLGVSHRTVMRLRDRGELHPYRVGRQLRYAPADVRRYLGADR